MWAMGKERWMQEESLDARKLLSILQKVLKMTVCNFKRKSVLCTNMREFHYFIIIIIIILLLLLLIILFFGIKSCEFVSQKIS